MNFYEDKHIAVLERIAVALEYLVEREKEIRAEGDEFDRRSKVIEKSHERYFSANCQNCVHRKKSADEMPCSDCRRYSKWEKKK